MPGRCTQWKQSLCLDLSTCLTPGWISTFNHTSLWAKDLHSYASLNFPGHVIYHSACDKGWQHPAHFPCSQYTAENKNIDFSTARWRTLISLLPLWQLQHIITRLQLEKEEKDSNGGRKEMGEKILTAMETNKKIHMQITYEKHIYIKCDLRRTD